MDFSNPSLIPVLSSAGVGLLVILHVVGQWWGRKRDMAPANRQTKDVVVPSLTIADNQVIQEQIKTLREANERSKDRERFESEMIMIARDMLDMGKEMLKNSNKQTDYLNEAQQHLRRIESNQPKGK